MDVTAQPVTIADAVTVPGPCRLAGFSVGGGGSALTVNIREENVSGAVLARIEIPASGASQTERLNVFAESGLYVEVAAGTATGSLFLG